jgi:hypothetical protein
MFLSRHKRNVLRDAGNDRVASMPIRDDRRRIGGGSAAQAGEDSGSVGDLSAATIREH